MNMKKLVLSLLVLLFCGVGFASETMPINQMVAIVNNEVITQSQLDHRMTLFKQQMAPRAKAEGQQLPADDVIKAQLLKQLIDRQLQLDAAHRMGIKVTAADIKKALSFMAKQQKTTVSALYQSMEKQGLKKADIDKEIREEVAIQKVQGQAIASMIHISPAEIDHAYLHQKGSDIQYHLADILVPTKAEANSIYSVLIKKNNFSNKQTNDLGWRKADELPREFANAAQKMKVGEISKPIAAPNGFHLLKLLDKKGETLTKAQVREMLFQQQFNKKQEAFIKELREQSYIKVM